MSYRSAGVMPQFDWLCDVCECVMSSTSSIYWVNLGFINNYTESQLWLVLLRYSADVASAFCIPWNPTSPRNVFIRNDLPSMCRGLFLHCCVLWGRRKPWGVWDHKADNIYTGGVGSFLINTFLCVSLGDVLFLGSLYLAPPTLIIAVWRVRLWVQDPLSACVTYQSKKSFKYSN